MRFVTRAGVRNGLVLPVAVLFTVVGLAFTSGPAQAATYRAYTNTWASNDAGGIDAMAALDKVGVSFAMDYYAIFHAHGEVLDVGVDRNMLSKGKVTVVVHNKYGALVDIDTFTVAIGDSREIQLGTPDGTGDIPEGYDVFIRVCVGASDTCTPFIMGNA